MVRSWWVQTSSEWLDNDYILYTVATQWVTMPNKGSAWQLVKEGRPMRNDGNLNINTNRWTTSQAAILDWFRVKLFGAEQTLPALRESKTSVNWVGLMVGSWLVNEPLTKNNRDVYTNTRLISVDFFREHHIDWDSRVIVILCYSVNQIWLKKSGGAELQRPGAVR